MVNSIFIFNKDKRVVDTLSNNGDSPKSPFFDDKYVQHLTTGAETFEFSTFSNDRTSKYCVAGNYVGFKYNNKVKMFQIVETSEDHSEGQVIKTCYCEVAGLELINFVVRPMEMPSANVKQFFESVLQGTSWALGMVDTALSTVKTVKIDKPTNVYTIIQDNLQDFNCEIEFRVEMSGPRVIGQYIDIHQARGRETRKRFEYGVNVSNVSKQIDISELYTAMIGIGKGGLDFKSVEWLSDKPAPKPKNQDFIVNPVAYEQWNKQGEQLIGVYENTECESAAELLQLTWNTLVKHSEPKFTYNVATEMIQGDEDEILLGDTVYVIDNDYEPALHLSARVGQLDISFTDHTKNECILTNFKDVKSGILSLETIQAIIDGKFPISGNEILDGTITGDKIGPQQITGTLIKADTIEAKHISANQIETKHLRAGSITAEKLTTGELITQSAQIKEGIIDKAQIKDGAIDNAKIEDASINAAKIQDAAIGTAQIADAAINNAKIGSLAVGTANIQNAAITNAKIKDLSADKITAGNIDAERLTANVIEAINASIGKIDADHITVGKIDASDITTGTLDAERLKASVIEAINASIGTATINSAKIGNLSADKITSGDIATDRLKANAINAVNATVGNATINSAKIGNLDASKITTGTLNADRIGAGTITANKLNSEVINSVSVNASNVVADKIAAGEIKVTDANILDGTINGAKIAKATISNAQIANATIESAKIKSIDAQKITTGKLDTSKVTVSSTQGNLTIANNTLQIKDNQATPQVRVQLGQDATGDYGLIVKDAKGQVMWDLTGATSNGIKDNAITTDKIKDESISSNKLMIDEIWASEGFINNFKAQDIDADRITTGTISGERIDINGMVSFNSLSTDMKESFTQSGGKTFIDGGNILTQTLTGNQINTRGFTARDNSGKTTLSIDAETGRVAMSGLVESYDFDETLSYGYRLTPEGDATFNNAVVRGELITPEGGVSNFGSSMNPNILTGSSPHIKSLTFGDWWEKICNDVPSNDFEAGKEYTYRVFIDHPSSSGLNRVHARVTIYKEDGSYTSVSGNPILEGQNGYSTVTFTVPEGTPKLAVGIDKNPAGADTPRPTIKYKEPKLEKGKVATNWCPHKTEKLDFVRFWAGSEYSNRDNAPFKVMSSGKIIATEGEFGGTFTGKLAIGNIHIEDTNNSKGSIDIKTNNDVKTMIHLEEDNSYINSNLAIGANFINLNPTDSIMDMRGRMNITNSSNITTTLGNGNNTIETTDGTNKFQQRHSGGMFVFDSYSTQPTDFIFSKEANKKPVRMEVRGELHARDKITMNNNISIVARQDSGNSGFDFVVG